MSLFEMKKKRNSFFVLLLKPKRGVTLPFVGIISLR